MLPRMIRSLLILALAVAVPSTTATAAPSVAQLAKDRAAAAEKAFKSATSALMVGRGAADLVCEWSERWMDAAIASGTKAKQAMTDHLQRMTDLEAAVTKEVNTGKMRPTDVEIVQYFRIEAEYWLAGGKR